MTTPEPSADSANPMTTLEKLHSETAKIAWLELQRFFAQGAVLWLSSDLDLVKTAVLLAEDKSAQVQQLLESKQLAPPSNQQARKWVDADAQLWSVVVAPFVLVQEIETSK